MILVTILYSYKEYFIGEIRMINHEDIIIVMTVNKFLSISKAAKMMYTGQSSLSKRIKDIEDRLGYRIFERSKGKKSVQLTENGSKLIPVLKEILNLSSHAVNIGNLNTKYKIRIATSDGPYNLAIDDIVLDLYKENPDSEFKLKSLSYRECIEVVADGTVDIAFVGNNIYKKELSIIPLYSEKIVFICMKSCNYEKPLNLSRLNVDKAVYSSYSSEFSSWFRKTFDNRHPLIRCDLIMQVAKYMKELNLWSIVPVSAAEYIAKFVDIDIVDIEGDIPDRIIYYAVKSGELSEPVQKIVRLIIEKLEGRKGIQLFRKAI